MLSDKLQKVSSKKKRKKEIDQNDKWNHSQISLNWNPIIMWKKPLKNFLPVILGYLYYPGVSWQIQI